tara:strand:+ start:177 stop:743 length:567 start_codon:yes stop_codon:yes gene_type:complete
MGKLDDTLTMHVDGFEDVIKKMQLLSKIDRTEYNAFKKGIKKSADPFVQNVRAVIHTGRSRKAIGKSIGGRGGKSKSVTYKPGNLKRSIGYIKGKGRNLIGYVGPRFGRKATKTGDGYYGAMVNFGASRGSAKANVKDTRNVGFIDKGFIKGVPAANALLVREVSRILNKKLTQLSAQQKRKIITRGF